MSLLNWLFPVKKPSRPDPPVGAPRKGASKAPSATSADPAKRKAERASRRELLYTVVREAMVRAGVLSASYTFKVLSLDTDGRQFLIMIDVARGTAGDASHLAEIEALIAQSAKSRHDLMVTAVYWRLNEPAAGGLAGARQAPRFTDSPPAPLQSHSAPAPLVATARSGAAYEPIHADEVEAFRKALAAGSSAPVPLAEARGVARAGARAAGGSGHNGPRSYTLLTGYEDTEMSEADQKSPVLSGTQYGDLH